MPLIRIPLVAGVLAGILIAPTQALGLPPPPCPPLVMVDDRCEAWQSVYDHPAAHSAGAFDLAGDIAASPDGKFVFVTGRSWDAETSRLKVATAAYSVETGDQLWATRYAGAEPENDYASSVVVSPDGSRVYVAGVEHMSPIGETGDLLTIAYDAATGKQLWRSTYDSPKEGVQDEEAHAAAVSPDGRWVYVTGETGGAYTNLDLAVVAYRADTGEEAWALEYSREPGAGEDIGVSVLATSDVVYVGGEGGTRIAALAIAAGDPGVDPDAGTLLWATANRRGFGYWIALSPDHSRVFLTGSDHTPTNAVLGPDWDYATMALDAATGQELWFSTYTGLEKGIDVPYAHALSPSGDRIYLTGRSQGVGGFIDGDFATVAYDTTNGARLWEARYTTGAPFELGADVVVSPSGSRVYVTGRSSFGQGQGDAVTLAYDASNGLPVWTARNDQARPDRSESGWRMTLAGSRLVITGGTDYGIDMGDPLNQQPGTNRSDYLTFAYDLP